MNHPIIRSIVTVAAAFAVSAVQAQPWPAKPISMIVPYAAGGNVDAVARWIAPELGKRLGQTVVIDNVAGAGGVIGTEKAARAAPDGLTDFKPVILLASAPLVLVGKPSLAANTLDELLKLMRAQPGKLNYATSGVGTSLHVAGEMVNQQAKVQMTHVPYKVGAQIVTDVMGGQIDLAMLPIPLTSEQIRSGKVKAFAVTEPQRSQALPNVPSMAEHPDTKGVDVTVWFGIFAPAKVDQAVTSCMQNELAEVLKDGALQQKLANFGMRTLGLGAAAFATFLAAEHSKFAAIVKAGNIRAE